jgi:hypothetical protein
MKTKYAIVREYIYGWDWSDFSDDDGVAPTLYASKEEAQASLDEYIRDVNESHDLGYIDEPYQHDMEIAEVNFDGASITHRGFNLAMNKISVEKAQAKFDADCKAIDMQNVIDEVITASIEKDDQRSAMIHEVSHKITKFMQWDEFEFVDDMNTLHPVIVKISSMWDDHAELEFDYGMINIFNALGAVDLLPHVEKCIDELNRREKSVYGSVYRITVENVAEYTELAKAIANGQVSHSQVGNYVWIDQNGFVCSFMKSSDDFKKDFDGEFVAEVGRDVVVGDTFQEIVAAVLTEMDDYTPSTVVNVNSVNQ